MMLNRVRVIVCALPKSEVQDMRLVIEVSELVRGGRACVRAHRTCILHYISASGSRGVFVVVGQSVSQLRIPVNPARLCIYW